MFTWPYSKRLRVRWPDHRRALFAGAAVIDSEGFRPNVGIIVCNGDGRVLWARRRGHDAWQFPQGGIAGGESSEEAMYRELHEEVGLQPGDVKILARTQGWLRYHLPDKFIRRQENPRCIGQKQQWFLLELIGSEASINLKVMHKPEFEDWRWVNYWYPLDQVIDFKRNVYMLAMKQLVSALPVGGKR